MFCPASRVEPSSSLGDSHALIIVLLLLEGAPDIKHLPFSAMLRGSTRGDWTSISSLAGASPLLRESLSSGERSLPCGTDDTRAQFNDKAYARVQTVVVVGVGGRLLSTPGCVSVPHTLQFFMLMRAFSGSLGFSRNYAYTLCIGAIIPHRNKMLRMSHSHD